MKNMLSDQLVKPRIVKPTLRTCSFFNYRSNVSSKYDTLLLQTNVKLVLRCMKNIKSPLNAE